jgi:hypothetical protein
MTFNLNNTLRYLPARTTWETVNETLFLFIMFDLFVLFLIQIFLFFGCNRLPWVRDFIVQKTVLSTTSHLEEVEEEDSIFIIRGVPGAGKKHLVWHMEKQFDDDENFCLCDKNDYFITNGKFKFNPKDLHHAEQQLRMKFIKALYESSLKRLYVIGYLEEYWMYEEFVKLGELNDYKVRVIDLRCPDEEHLIYFNKRGTMSPPLIKSKKCFEVWEHDSTAYIQEPYIEPLEGDCLPKYNTETIEKNNKVFEDYLNGECVIESDDEFDKTHEYSCDDNGDHIECLTEKDIENILENQIVLL